EFQNYTIDDFNGDEKTGVVPIYNGPSGVWNVRRANQPCEICLVNPDGNLMLNGTWYDPAATVVFSFIGTDIWVYCALAGQWEGGITTDSHLKLLLDGAIVDSFDWSPTPSAPQFTYHQAVLSAKDLENKEHIVAVQSGPKLGASSLILFDYVLYTAEEHLTSTQAQPIPTQGTIESTPDKKEGSIQIGLGLGIGLGIFFAGTALWIGTYFTRRRRRKRVQRDPRQTIVGGSKPAGGSYIPLLDTRRSAPHITTQPASSQSHLPLPLVAEPDASSNSDVNPFPIPPIFWGELGVSRKEVEMLRQSADEPPRYPGR
ncbi:hypothetical protein BKA62DRAFT_737878, partial [Auriculariales sp. MPI-PUGE-AT-0066]